MNTKTTPPTKPLQERIAALSTGDMAEVARRASVSKRTLQNISKGLYKQHASTVRNIERALSRFKPTSPTAE